MKWPSAVTDDSRSMNEYSSWSYNELLFTLSFVIAIVVMI